MLIIALVILLLAVTSSVEANYNYLADYVKFNRIVFIIFILGGYLAYNALDITAFGNGIGIYGGVFKITVLSQVFDIILFITGAIVTILTCFAPYNFKVYNNNTIRIPTLLTDNESALKLANNPEFHKRSKHIDITYHFIREAILDKKVDLIYVNTKKQLADGFTKALDNIKHKNFINCLNLKEI